MADLVQIVLSILTFAISGGLAYYLAKHFGDVAGTNAAIKYEKEKAAEERAAALHSLRNEVARIRKLTEYYKKPFADIGVPKMPMTAFETAFVSGSPGLVAGSELLKAVNEYLVHADIVNSVIDMYLIKEHRGEFSDITRACDPLAEILDRLDECLKRELKA